MKEKMRTDRKDFFSMREEKEISSETIFSKRDEEKVGGKITFNWNSHSTKLGKNCPFSHSNSFKNSFDKKESHKN